ncbi:MAG: asparagine synthase (glutamine-hydrolyzing) [Proteobacteria bacterium]|nr:asparagine synthase (glutamine-hydrolyzing) [Pseudomonadota bacterium]
MCGFAGIYDISKQSGVLGEYVCRMTAMIAHRGPDAEGVYSRNGIALGHRRLSILDLSPSGVQPMTLGENGPTIVFNGEVYNFTELRQELKSLGRAFKGHSDTEVMLHAYAEWGLSGLRRFEGIFAFALWDPSQERLILMRDRFGVKPLFVSRNGSRLVFGSEIKVLFASGDIDNSIDDQALAEYLWYGNAYEDRTIYRGVNSLLPGHWLVAEKGKLTIEPWWQLEEWIQPHGFASNEEEAAIAVRDALDVAVKRQLVADVPVGLFLSGGIDSSSIAAAAMHVQNKPLASYSVCFDFDGGINELPKARRVAKDLALDHHEIQVSGVDLEEVLLALVRSHDEPFADAANIPLYLLARQLRGSIKVVLQGDGGDEMFAGYRRYAMLRNVAYWRMWPKRLTPLVSAGFGSIGRRFERMADAVGAEDPAMRMALLLTTETLQDPPSALLNRDVQSHLASNTDPFLSYRHCAARFSDADPVQQMLLTDISLQLPSQFLAKVDRSTMAYGLEARVPFLDETVARLAVSLPAKWKANGSQKKIILRNAMRGRVPDNILDGPKTGFGVPYKRWLKTSLYDFARETVLDPIFLARLGFDRAKLEMAFSEHYRGIRDRGFTLWKVLQLALWSIECP